MKIAHQDNKIDIIIGKHIFFTFDPSNYKRWPLSAMGCRSTLISFKTSRILLPRFQLRRAGTSFAIT